MKTRILGIWKDPVWSKVISVVIIAIASTIWGWIAIEGFKTSLNLLIRWSKFKLSAPVWAVILGIFVIWLLTKIFKFLRQRSVGSYRSPVLDERVGNYSFVELFNMLAAQKLRNRTERMLELGIGPPDQDLIQLFIENRDTFNDGLRNTRVSYISRNNTSYDDGGYLFDIVAPKLESFGLLNKEEKPGFFINRATVDVTYLTSEAGYQFFDCWDRLRQDKRHRF